MSRVVSFQEGSSCKGCKSNTGDFIQSLQDSVTGGCISAICDIIHKNLGYPAVGQLWSEVKCVMKSVNALMIHFISLFGTIEGNGLSLFARDFSSLWI